MRIIVGSFLNELEVAEGAGEGRGKGGSRSFIAEANATKRPSSGLELSGTGGGSGGGTVKKIIINDESFMFTSTIFENFCKLNLNEMLCLRFLILVIIKQ